jgi:hypothetical protein
MTLGTGWRSSSHRSATRLAPLSQALARAGAVSLAAYSGGMLGRWRPVAVVIGVVLVVVLAGCGGSSRLSKAAYQGKLRATYGSMESSLAKILPALTRPGGVSGSTYGRALSSVLAADAAALAKLNPPAAAATDNARLVAGLRYMAQALTGGSKGVSALASIVAGNRNPARLPRVLREMNGAGRDLQRQGYRLSQSIATRRPGLGKKPGSQGIPDAGGPSSPIDCSAVEKVTFYKGRLLTLAQVKAAFASNGLELRAAYPKDPSLGYEVSALPNGSVVLVALAARCNEGPPGFAYIAGSPAPTRTVVQNVDIEYHVPSNVAVRIKATIAALKREVRP